MSSATLWQSSGYAPIERISMCSLLIINHFHVYEASTWVEQIEKEQLNCLNIRILHILSIGIYLPSIYEKYVQVVNLQKDRSIS